MHIFLLVVLVLVLLVLAFSYWLFYIGICRFPKDPEVKVPKKLAEHADEINSGIAWFKAQKPERICIPAHDGTKLSGLYLGHEDARGTVILVHGFRSDAYYDFSCAFRFYYEQGYSLLAVFQRAHGESGGAYITFGVKERYDCLDWARYVLDRFGTEHDIFLSGISMGSSTVLMSAGLGLPGSVRGIIADCGYTSPYDEFLEVLRRRHVPAHPFIELAEMYARIFAGFSFRECSTLDAMRRSTVPVLFVHGEADRFVPARFSQENYDACIAEKQLLLVPDAGHGCSYLVDKPRCQAALSGFLKRYSTLSSAPVWDGKLPSESAPESAAPEVPAD